MNRKLLLWMLLPAGCNGKAPVYNTPHPDKGAVILSADRWTRGETTTDVTDIFAGFNR